MYAYYVTLLTSYSYHTCDEDHIKRSVHAVGDLVCCGWGTGRFDHAYLSISLAPSGNRLNIKMPSYQYRDPHVEDKTVSRPSYLEHGNPHTWKRRSLYWDGALTDCPVLPTEQQSWTMWVYVSCGSIDRLQTKQRKLFHDDVIKWKHFPRNCPFVRGIHRSPVNSPHKGQWRGALMFSLICVWINDWVNNREAGDLRRYRAHYDVIVMHISGIYCISQEDFGVTRIASRVCHMVTIVCISTRGNFFAQRILLESPRIWPCGKGLVIGLICALNPHLQMRWLRTSWEFRTWQDIMWANGSHNHSL